MNAVLILQYGITAKGIRVENLKICMTSFKYDSSPGSILKFVPGGFLFDRTQQRTPCCWWPLCASYFGSGNPATNKKHT